MKIRKKEVALHKVCSCPEAYQVLVRGVKRGLVKGEKGLRLPCK